MVLLPILTLTLAAFAIGTTEFAVQGLLPEIASDLGVSIPATGLLVTGYALGVAFGGPVMALAINSLSRKAALQILMSIFIIGHLLAALAPNYAFLLVARVVTSLCHGAFMGIGSVVAISIVPTERRASAVALMWAGIASANILGVPAGTVLGHAFGWRATFAAIGALGVAAFAALSLGLPQTERGVAGRLVAEIKVLARPQVLLTLGLSACVCAATFSVFTYVAPLLENVTGIPAGALPVYLLVFGVGGVLGMQIGGRVGDRRLMAAIIGSFLGDLLVYVALLFAIHRPPLALLAMGIWGFSFYFIAAPLQLRIVDEARGAPNLASTVIQSAFNFGIAVGPFLGAIVLASGAGYATLPICGAVLSIVGVGGALWSVAIKRRLVVAPLAEPRGASGLG